MNNIQCRNTQRPSLESKDNGLLLTIECGINLTSGTMLIRFCLSNQDRVFSNLLKTRDKTNEDALGRFQFLLFVSVQAYNSLTSDRLSLYIDNWVVKCSFKKMKF